MLSVTLRHFEEKEVGAYVNFLIMFGGVICECLSRKKILEKKLNHENQYKMKVDFIQCYENVFNYLSDEQSLSLIGLNFPLEECLVSILAEFDQNTTLGCLKMIGELVTNCEKVTTKIVSEMPHLNLMRSLSLILINHDS